MKVKCTQLLNAAGEIIDHSPWLVLGQIYHVLSIFISHDGKRSYEIVSYEHDGEWPSVGSHQAECFEIVSAVVPSNWRAWIHESSAMGVSPLTWQDPHFNEGFFDHDPETYPVFLREWETILREDP